MNFLGSFWIVSLAGSLLSTQNPLQPTNQDASQPPEAASSGDTSSSVDSPATPAETSDLNLFLPSQSSYAPGLSLLSCEHAFCSKETSLTGDELLPTDGLIDFPAGQNPIRGELTGLQSRKQSVERRFPLGKLNPLAPPIYRPLVQVQFVGICFALGE